MDLLYTTWNIAAAALGACLGSFLGVCVLRIPEGESIVQPGSHCPTCGTPVAWHDNIPLVSWLVLGARCRHCGTPISALYPMLEATTACVAWLVWRRFVPSPAHLDVQHVAAFVLFLTFAWCLLCAAYTDLRARIVPELASQWMVPAMLAGHALLGWLGYDGWLAIGAKGAVIGAAGAGGVLFLVAEVWSRLFGHEGLGRGDVWLMALIGGALGLLPGAWTVLLVASLSGAAAGIVSTLVRGRGSFAFAPWLAGGGLAYLLWGDVLVARWLGGR